ncbi:hypothetical protein PENVUL_c003G06035 [Penicillium vulpinum]|uniref:Uncharacterized protein n=1 Tax=Penicillium vulpinum TaxID=29845 RepID=A0A1V6SAN4_9EURO|nr:hypothetical protein PENVUL_c003G06035 [Penicillium vulpinum]
MDSLTSCSIRGFGIPVGLYIVLSYQVSFLITGVVDFAFVLTSDLTDDISLF